MSISNAYSEIQEIKIKEAKFLKNKIKETDRTAIIPEEFTMSKDKAIGIVGFGVVGFAALYLGAETNIAQSSLMALNAIGLASTSGSVALALGDSVRSMFKDTIALLSNIKPQLKLKNLEKELGVNNIDEIDYGELPKVKDNKKNTLEQENISKKPRI